MLRATGLIALGLLVGSCGVTRPTVDDVPTRSDLAPSFVADSDAVLFIHEAASSSESMPSGIYIASLASGHARLVLRAYSQGVDWIPGTDSAVVALGGGVAVVALADGSGHRVVAHDAFEPRSSRDGRYISFHGGGDYPDNYGHVYVFDRATGELSDVTPDTMACSAASWSPSGEQLAMVGSSRARSGVFVVTRSGVVVRQLTQTALLPRDTAWSPSGAWVAWTALAGSAVVISTMDTLGTHAATLTRGYLGMTWVHGDSSLVYSSVTSAGPRLFQIDMATRTTRQLTF